MTTAAGWTTLTGMTLGGRLTRWIVAILLAVGLAAGTPPALAAKSSPHQTVNQFWDLVQHDRGARAYLDVEPSCRTVKGRQKLQQASHKLASAGGFITVDTYREKIHNNTAVVSYVLTFHKHGKSKAILKFRGQRWVQKKNHWYIGCKQNVR